MSDIKQDLMTTAEAANELNVTQRHIQRMINAGELEGRKLHARTWLVSAESVAAKKRERADQLPNAK